MGASAVAFVTNGTASGMAWSCGGCRPKQELVKGCWVRRTCPSPLDVGIWTSLYRDILIHLGVVY